MNRAESAIGEAIGVALGVALRMLFDLLVFAVLPLLTTAAIGLFFLHAWLTSVIADALGLADSLLVRIAIGIVVFPATISVAAIVLGTLSFAGYFLVTTDMYLAIKVVLALMFVGALLSFAAFVRDHLGSGVDDPLELDFSAFSND